MTTSTRMAKRRAATERKIGRLRASIGAVLAVALGLALALLLPDATRVPVRPPSTVPPSTSTTPVRNVPQEPPGGPVTTAPRPTHRDEGNAGSGREAPPGGSDDPTPAPAPPPGTAPPPSAGSGPGPDPGPPATSQGEDLVLVDFCIDPLGCLEGGLL